MFLLPTVFHNTFLLLKIEVQTMDQTKVTQP